MSKKPWGVFVRTYPVSLSDITSLASTSNSTPTWVMWFKQWDGGNFAYTASEFSTLLSSGYTPLLTWQPRYQNSSVSHITSASITSGSYDSLIDSYANGIKALSGTVWIRLMHEMNGTWDDWMIGQNDYTTGAVYVATYQHIVNRFRVHNNLNVKWVWCPNVEFAGQTATFSQVYPGDSYVDIIGLDGYNQGDGTGHTWQSFLQIFSQSITDIVSVAPTKPFYIMETGSVESVKQNSKAAWIEDTISQVAKDSRIQGFNYWHATGSNGSPDYGINTSIESSLAFTSSLTQVTGWGSLASFHS